MGEKKRLDTTHPDCEEYTKKFKALWDAYYTLEKQEKEKFPDWNGKDHPANDALIPAYNKCCADTKALQNQYSYLFIKETEDEH